MKLIYIDDYGNTGRRLDDDKQPLFLLCAISIPEENWAEIEYRYSLILNKLTDRIEVYDDSFEIHAAHFFSTHNKLLVNIPPDDRAAIAFEIVELAASHGIDFTCAYLEKSIVAPVMEAFDKGNDFLYDNYAKNFDGIDRDLFNEIMNIMNQHIGLVFDPYPMALGALLDQLNSSLHECNQRGIIIIDQQDQYKQSKFLKSFAALRNPERPHLSNILEQPVIGDGKVNTMLQIADLICYFAGTSLSIDLGYRKPLPIHQRSIDLVKSKLKVTLSFSKMTVTSQSVLAEFASHSLGVKATSRIINDLIASGMVMLKKGEEIPEGLEQQ